MGLKDWGVKNKMLLGLVTSILVLIILLIVIGQKNKLLNGIRSDWTPCKAECTDVTNGR